MPPPLASVAPMLRHRPGQPSSVPKSLPGLCRQPAQISPFVCLPWATSGAHCSFEATAVSSEKHEAHPRTWNAMHVLRVGSAWADRAATRATLGSCAQYASQYYILLCGYLDMRRALQRHRLLTLPHAEHRNLLLPCQLAQTLFSSPSNSAEAGTVTTDGSGSADGGGADVRFLQRKPSSRKPEQERLTIKVNLLHPVPELRCSTVPAVCAHGCGRGAATAAAGGPVCCPAAASHAARISTAGEVFARSGGSMCEMRSPWWERAPRGLGRSVSTRPLAPPQRWPPRTAALRGANASSQITSATMPLCTCNTLAPVTLVPSPPQPDRAPEALPPAADSVPTHQQPQLPWITPSLRTVPPPAQPRWNVRFRSGLQRSPCTTSPTSWRLSTQRYGRAQPPLWPLPMAEECRANVGLWVSYLHFPHLAVSLRSQAARLPPAFHRAACLSAARCTACNRGTHRTRNYPFPHVPGACPTATV